MTKLRQTVAAILAGAFLFGLAGCNGGEKEVDREKNTVATIETGLSEPAAEIDVLKLNGTDCQNGLLSVMILQGVINKKQPRVYVYGLEGELRERVRFETLKAEE
ncbi:MAG: hypothetical protein ACI4ST_05960, partial [Candidatus Gallimonas sp.]